MSLQNQPISERAPLSAGEYRHSYDKYFSTTNLARLSDAGTTAAIRRGASHAELSAQRRSFSRKSTTNLPAHGRTASHSAAHAATVPTSPIDTFTPLLLRTGSRVWEDIQESKGQRWLSSKHSSSNLYAEQGDDDDDDDEDDYSRARNEHHRRRSTASRQVAGEDYNPLADLLVDQIDSDSEFLTTSITPVTAPAAGGASPRKPQFMAGGGEDEEESSEDEYNRFATVGPSSAAVSSDPATMAAATATSLKLEPSHNKIIAAVDWLLGVGQDDPDKAHVFADLYDGRARKHAAALTPEERIDRRDEEQGLNMDVALVLGYFVSYIFQ